MKPTFVESLFSCFYFHPKYKEEWLWSLQLWNTAYGTRCNVFSYRIINILDKAITRLLNFQIFRKNCSCFNIRTFFKYILFSSLLFFYTNYLSTSIFTNGCITRQSLLRAMVIMKRKHLIEYRHVRNFILIHWQRIFSHWPPILTLVLENVSNKRNSYHVTHHGFAQNRKGARHFLIECTMDWLCLIQSIDRFYATKAICFENIETRIRTNSTYQFIFLQYVNNIFYFNFPNECLIIAKMTL